MAIRPNNLLAGDPNRRWLRLGLGVLTLTVFVGALVTTLALTLSGWAQSSNAPTSNRLLGAIPLGESGGLTLPGQAGAPLVLGVDDSPPAAVLIDPSSGLFVGRVAAGYKPWVLARLSRGQVLVSQLFGPGSSPDEPSREATLRVFSAANLGTPVATIPMANRAAGVFYAPRMVLSGNEQYLYYLKSGTVCPEGGDASVCDTWQIGVIDLDQGIEVAEAQLRTGCRYPMLTPLAQTDLLAVCDQAPLGPPAFLEDVYTATKVTARGSATEVASFPLRREGVWLKNIVFTGVTATNEYFAVYDDGAVFPSGGDSPLVDLIPGDGRVSLNGSPLLDSDRLLIAYKSGFYAELHVGAVVLDRSDPTVFGTVEFQRGVRHVGPLDSSHVVLLHDDGTLAVLDLETGDTSTRDTFVPGALDWLVGR